MKRAFTLIELMTAISIIMLLVGMLAAGGMVVLQHARKSATRALIAQVGQALHAYRDEDSRRRFPPALADQTIRYRVEGAYAAPQVAIASLLMKQGLPIHGDMLEEDAGGRFLADRWGGPIHYHVDETVDGTPDRPLDGAGQPVRVPGDVTDWNPQGDQPYAYVWSRGRPQADGGLRVKATDWIYLREGP